MTTAWMEQSPGLYRGNEGKELHHRYGWMVQCRSQWSDCSRWCNMALRMVKGGSVQQTIQQALVAPTPGVSRIMTGRIRVFFTITLLPCKKRNEACTSCSAFRRLQVLAGEGYSWLRSDYISVKDTLSVYIEETSLMNVIEDLKQIQHQVNICFLNVFGIHLVKWI